METIEVYGRPLPLARLVQGAGGLAYRASQFTQVVLLDPTPLSETLNNARVESALIHCRALAYFLLDGRKSARYNLRIFDYSTSAWIEESEARHDVTSKIIEVTSNHLAHASPGDLDDPGDKPEPHPGAWPLVEMTSILTHGLAQFVDALAQEHIDQAAWFCPPPPRLTWRAVSKSRAPEARTSVSVHPKVGELTRTLHDYLDANPLTISDEEE